MKLSYRAELAVIALAALWVLAVFAVTWLLH